MKYSYFDSINYNMMFLLFLFKFLWDFTKEIKFAHTKAINITKDKMLFLIGLVFQGERSTYQFQK